MNSEIAVSFETILELLNDINYPLSRYLNRGLEESAIKKKFSHYNLEVTGDMIKLYGYKNGTKDDRALKLGQVYLLPGYYFMEIEEAFVQYESMIELEEWDRQWFPFLASGGGDFLAIDLSVGAKSFSRIIEWVEGFAPEVEYNSVNELLESVKNGIEKNIIFVDEEGYLDMDYDLYDKIKEEG